MSHHTHPLDGKRVALAIGPLFEDVEATYPLYRLREAGAEVTIVGTEPGQTVTGKKGQPLETEKAAKDLSPDDVDVLVLPGGFGPDKLRTDDGVKRLVRGMDEAGKPIAFICHAGWIPASAGILHGRTATSYPSIADDVRNAGAEWIDEPVVVDGNLISSRKPDDLPAFCEAIIEAATREPAEAGA